MTTLITGATGKLGGLTTGHLLDRVPATEVAVSVRDPAKAAALAAKGVDVRRGDFDRPEELDFTGVDRLLLISADGPDDVRITKQAAAVRAARDAGVGHIAYTSVVDAPTTPIGFARVHRATEEVIAASGIPYTFLRNAMYHENYTLPLAAAYERGALISAAGDGGNATASRDDLALAAAVVLSTDGHENTAYELTGPRAWTFAELAALASRATGKPLAHQEVRPVDYLAELRAGGVPDFLAELFVDHHAHIRDGVLSTVRPDLEELVGRPLTTIEQAVRVSLT
ncbi:SDR family oxidoreductase [Umezawaea endophytica]|uniref:SDR family oxidoreductase n=1 Tax=Umezawaea endophytica TaxID=1654476 RepID=A0A9X3AG15_9PSEU|nr:SDR family oxidoreductase [Umezawaea endophytica]MCS7479011.1 SDR family oxidoreductase [Umezawaea endophytica]